MSGPPYDLFAFLRGLAGAWRNFFHAPLDTRVCGWLRIGYALLVLINLACWYPDLARWFSDAGVLTAARLPEWTVSDRWTLLTMLPGDPATVRLVYWVFLAQTICLLLGVASRFNAICVLVWLISFQNRNPLIINAEDTVLRLLGWFVVLMPVGRAWAVDRWLWRGESVWGSDHRPAWGLRLLQIQMAAIYLAAVWQKLQGDQWRDGTALYFVARLEDYFGRFPQPDWIWDTPWSVRLLTWSVLGMELLVPILIWFRQTRPLALLLALAFHLGSEYSMHFYLFHWSMLLGWSAFLLPADFGRRRTKP
jgi:hypothetical protein